MNTFEAAVTAALATLIALAALALTVAVLTIGGVGLCLFILGATAGWLLPRPRQ